MSDELEEMDTSDNGSISHNQTEPSNNSAVTSDMSAVHVPTKPSTRLSEFARTSSQEEEEVLLTLSLMWYDKPERRKKHLEQTLQTWFSKNIKVDCTLKDILDDWNAVISLKPTTDVEEVIKKLTGQILTKKGETTKFIRITSITPKQQQLKEISHKASVNANLFQGTEQQEEAPSGAKSDPVPPANDEICDGISVDLYSYLSHIYKEKLQEIKSKNRVEIVAEVKVSFKAQQGDGDPKKAFNEFVDLVQSIDSFGGPVIPRKLVDSDRWSEALNISALKKNKLLLVVSSDEVLACGPQESRDAFNKCLNAMPQTSASAVNDDIDQRLQGQPLRMTIRDNLLGAGLNVEKSFWQQMTAVDRKIKNIQTKFNVDFDQVAGSNRDEFQIKARYIGPGENLSMETHAITALLRLYQRTATSVLSFNQDLMEKIDLENGLDDTTNGYVIVGKQPEEKGATAKDIQEDNCSICLGPFINKTQLKCKHEFCEACLRRAKESSGAVCPLCREVFGMIEGDQPEGTMTWFTENYPLLGFPNCGQIIITYNIPSGLQTERHPHPGTSFSGITRNAYLPDNSEGKEVLHLLRRAFDQKLIFTIGTSRTTGRDNQVTWNDIHHKTSQTGGPQNFGYPDPVYLSRVKEELKAKGIK